MTRTAGEVLIRAIDGMLRWLAYGAGLLIVAIALLIVFNVIRRYVFGDPMFGEFDLIQMGMVPAVFFAMAYCGRVGGHVSVDILSGFAPAAFWRVADTLVRLLVAGAFALLAWRAAAAAESALRYGEATNLLRIDHAPFWWCIVIGAGLSALLYLAESVLTATGHRDPLAKD